MRHDFLLSTHTSHIEVQPHQRRFVARPCPCVCNAIANLRESLTDVRKRRRASWCTQHGQRTPDAAAAQVYSKVFVVAFQALHERSAQRSNAHAFLQVLEVDEQADEKFMRLALREAEKVWLATHPLTPRPGDDDLRKYLQAASRAEVPVGAVVVCDNEVLCTAYNKVEASGDPTQHAELLAIQEAAVKLGRFQLSRCTLYVTLEPCPMCAGALLQARIGRTVYGSKNTLLGTSSGIRMPLPIVPMLQTCTSKVLVPLML